MRNLNSMILKVAAEGSATRLVVEIGDGIDNGARWLASIMCDDEIVTMESNWDALLIGGGATMEDAIAALDAICAEDLAESNPQSIVPPR